MIREELTTSSRYNSTFKKQRIQPQRQVVGYENLESFPEAIKFSSRKPSWGKDIIRGLLSDYRLRIEKFRVTIENFPLDG